MYDPVCLAVVLTLVRPEARSSISRTMRSAGFSVREASGNYDVSLIALEEPDLILLDLSHSGPAGLELCRQLKQLPQTSSIPILALGADLPAETEQRCDAELVLPNYTEPAELIGHARTLLRIDHQTANVPGNQRPLAEIENVVQWMRRHSSDDPGLAAACNAAEQQVKIITQVVDDLLSPAENGSSANGPSARNKARRVLIVEDNPDTAECFAMLLKLMGHEVHVAHTGPAAVTLALESRPEVVLLDIGLPEMDGYDVARRLRLMPETAEAFLVAVTGFGNERDRRRGQEVGFDLFLVKPVRSKIIQEVFAALDHKHEH